MTRVLVDSALELESMQAFARAYLPDSPVQIELYSGQRPLFDLHGVEEELARTPWTRKVPLKIRRPSDHRSDRGHGLPSM